MTSTISSPEHLHFPCEGKECARAATLFGFDQDWFSGFWQRKAGCGPCTGANILLYLSRMGRISLDEETRDRAGFLRLMEQSWQYLTPGIMGLNSPFMMQQGLDAFFEERGSGLRARALEIPAEPSARPDSSEAEAFIRDGLAADSPVAFLNLSNGDIPHLESWHWVTVVGVEGEGDKADLLIYDNGNSIRVNLYTWLHSTRRGGGFVYVADSAA
ncbi:MAG TPA: hypothetical protein VLA21_01160 [Candidatus Limnocylindria bacterium]|nr:hypothetical protein [Candidatus Limnocylindria bacterium]